MQVITNGLPLSEAEKDQYVRYIREKYPDRIIDEDSVAIRCEYHTLRPVAKMGGYYIGDPETWNSAKQAELRDTLPNRL